MTESRVVYSNKWMALREDEIVRADGSPGVYAVVEKPDFATIAAFEEDGFWLVKQDRYPTGTRTWEFPQGTYDDSDPQSVACAELAQETGVTAEFMLHVGTLYNAPGLTSQACHVFFATGLKQGKPDRDSEEQDMVHGWFGITEMERMIREGQTVETVTIATLALLRIKGLI